jgi:hypothetical protein
MSESVCLVGFDAIRCGRSRGVGSIERRAACGAVAWRPGGARCWGPRGFGRPACGVYEAGPTGFGLARAATARGLDVRVIAPGSIPCAPGDRVKTDRRDAKRLVRLFAAGKLSLAFVPSEAGERFS